MGNLKRVLTNSSKRYFHCIASERMVSVDITVNGDFGCGCDDDDDVLGDDTMLEVAGRVMNN